MFKYTAEIGGQSSGTEVFETQQKLTDNLNALTLYWVFEYSAEINRQFKMH